jgi:enamidase
MSHDPVSALPKGKLVIRNIGMVLSGAMENPILDADTVVVVDGRIAAIGRLKDVDTDDADQVIDANQAALAPGLIDSHVHPVAGDWTPRQNQIGWIDSTMHGGVTTMISAGEVHTPGRPTDIVGLKALAIAAQRTFTNFRPGGVKIHAGAPIIEQGMVEQDFKDLADAGVRLLGEIGLGSVKDPYRRPLGAGLGPDRRRRRFGGGHRCRRPHQWRPHGPAGSGNPLHLRRL